MSDNIQIIRGNEDEIEVKSEEPIRPSLPNSTLSSLHDAKTSPNHLKGVRNLSNTIFLA